MRHHSKEGILDLGCEVGVLLKVADQAG